MSHARSFRGGDHFEDSLYMCKLLATHFKYRTFCYSSTKYKPSALLNVYQDPPVDRYALQPCISTNANLERRFMNILTCHDCLP